MKTEEPRKFTKRDFLIYIVPAMIAFIAALSPFWVPALRDQLDKLSSPTNTPVIASPPTSQPENTTDPDKTGGEVRTGHIDTYPPEMFDSDILVVDYWYSDTDENHRIISSKVPTENIAFNRLTSGLTWWVFPASRQNRVKEIQKSTVDYLNDHPDATIDDTDLKILDKSDDKRIKQTLNSEPNTTVTRANWRNLKEFTFMDRKWIAKNEDDRGVIFYYNDDRSVEFEIPNGLTIHVNNGDGWFSYDTGRVSITKELESATMQFEEFNFDKFYLFENPVWK